MKALIPIRRRIFHKGQWRDMYWPRVVNYDGDFMRTISKPKSDAEQIERECLKCTKTFIADGRFQRLCEKCKAKVAFISPTAFGVMGE